MNRSYMINDYINDNENKLKDRNQAMELLNELRFRISDTKTITELMIEVSNFFQKYNVPDEIKDGITAICNDFDENADVLTARDRLEEYLTNIVNDKEKEYNDSDDVVDDIKTDVILSANNKLESVGIKLVGDDEIAKESINEYSDVSRINENVDNVYDYLYEQNKIVNENNQSIELSVDKFNEVAGSPKDGIFLDEAINYEKNSSDSGNLDLFQVNDNGTVQVNGNYNDGNSINFATMMAMSLLIVNDGKITADLDMKFIKEKNDQNKFKMIFGNFPIVNHPENKLNANAISGITKLVSEYKPNTNYMEILSGLSIELKLALDIIYNNVLGQEGAFQMAIRSNDIYNDMAFGMDKNYSNILDAFNINGAYVSYDENENGIVTVNETLPGNQLLILSATNESLNSIKEEKTPAELINNPQLIKKIDNRESANANYTLLIVMCITEILLLSVYFIFLFNK